MTEYDNPMRSFVDSGSIVRHIWGKSDTVLFIFAGSAAEFSLHKSVDWLYFTGRLPADPIGRLFSTVTYAKRIIFSDETQAFKAIDRIREIHSTVERNRGFSIPDWAYRDVLYMLIHFSIAAFEMLERKLTLKEKKEVYRVFCEVGLRMGIAGLPAQYKDWLVARQKALAEHFQKSSYTVDLYQQYRKHLGPIRYYILLKIQSRLLPDAMLTLLGLRPSGLLKALLPAYKIAGKTRLQAILKRIYLPSEYYEQIQRLDQIMRQ